MSFARFCWTTLASCAALTLANCRPAAAELTVDDLTGKSVAGVGPFYQDVNDAIRAFGAQEYAKAFNHLQSAKKLTPRLAPPEIMMAQLYFDAGQIAQGISMLEVAVHQGAQDPEGYVMFAERAVADGRVTEAGLMFDKAAGVLEKFSENAKRKQSLQVRLYTGWAAVEEAAGNMKEAQKKLEELIKFDPNGAASHAKLGRVLFRLGDQKQAYAEFQAACEVDKKRPLAELEMAGLTTDKLKAEQWVNRVLKITPVELRTRLAACEYFMRANQIDDARTQAQEALKLDPDGLDSNLAVGIMDRLSGDYQVALPHLSTAHMLNPSNPVVTNHLALTLLELPDEASRQRALEFAELNARQNPNIPEVIATLGWINFRLNRPLEAQKAFTAVFNSNALANNQAMSAEVGYYMARMAKDKGQDAKALAILKDALSKNQPFAYRKAAQELFAELSKAEKAQTGKTREKASPKAAEAATKTGAAK